VEPSDRAKNDPRNTAPGSGVPTREIGMPADSDDWLRFVVQNFSEIVMVVDPDDTLGYASPAFERILGYDPREAQGKNMLDFVHPDDLTRVREETERIISGGDPGGTKALEYRIRHKDGSWRWIEGAAARGDDPAVRGIVLNARDITERKEAEERLREAEERYRTLVEQIPVVAYIDRADGTDTPLYTSPQIEGLLGYNQQEASSGRLWRERLHPEDRERVLAADERFEKEGEERFREEYRLLAKNGSVVWVLEDAVLVKDATGSPLYWQGILYDITERKEAEEWLEHRAFHDPLTDLPNRQLVLDRLGHALTRTDRRQSSGVAVLFLDLDRFKIVNDSLGHEAGDQLLVMASERLKGCLRPEDTLARFGGDEFVVLVEDVKRPEQAIHVAERLIECLEDPFVLEGRELFVRASIGIAFGTARTQSAEDLLRDADTAMYRAKYERLDYALFDPALYERAVRRLQLENDLRRAVEREELVLYYQPIFEFGSQEVWGVEALVRWKHPERGLLGPTEFIALAEETGLIGPIGRWVLNEACRRTKGWQQSYPRSASLRVIVNFSATQLHHPGGEETIREALASSGLGTESLSLDVTESTFIDAVKGDALILERIENLGVGICVDDFGTGYSSLSYLKRLPADVLKIDKSFVKGIGEDDEDTAIARMVVELAHTLGMKVIAEGVETKEQVALLEEMGCDMAQGFHFERPLPPEVVSEILLDR
jgi:diguanylate cyclase (GGDEF)-like protein/PAS domain S-box-containing protein